MPFSLTQGFSKRPSVGRILPLAAAVLFCFILSIGSVTAQTADDHGDDFNNATNLPLGSSITGRIDPGDDRDVFKLDLSGASGNTHVWVYTTGELDTSGALYDSNGNLLTDNDDTTSGSEVIDTNFRIPWTLAPGVYYVSVVSADRLATGDYTLHAKADDHGHSFDTATTLLLGDSAAGSIDPEYDRDMFKLDLSGASGNTHVWVYTTGELDTSGALYDSNGNLLTDNDDTTSGSEVIDTNFRIPWTLAPGVYYVSVVSADRLATGDYTLHAKADDHGHSFDTATTLLLGDSAAGSIDPEYDRDVFKLDLSGTSGTTDVWIYTTGELDTRGWLYDSNGDRLAFNNDSYIVGRKDSFQLRRNLSSGVYYLSVRSWAGAIGDYTLHAEAVADPGNTTGTATTLNLATPTPGMIDTADDSDYFRLVLADYKNLVVYALSSGLYDRTRDLLLPEPLHGTVLDDTGADISVNVYDKGSGFEIMDDFDPGTYYIKVTVPSSDATYPVPYTIHAYEDTDYTEFIDGCAAETAELNNPQISDPLYGCQWHLRNQEQGGEDINVEPVWAEGINGEGVNIAVVDDGMYYAHEDLAPNVDTALNHNYDTGNRDSRDIYGRYEHHGTAVAGVIAAQDNGIGVRGVAPRATVYGYNYLAGDWQQFEDRNLADAMSRNRVVTAISNNSWVHVDGPWLGLANRLWELAIDSGIREGYEGKGTFYVFAGGNGGRGHRENPDGTPVGGHIDSVRGRGDDSNLSEFSNHYAVTAVCAVNDQDTRSDYSEKGANLWVCAPSNDLREGYSGVVTTENSDRYQHDFGGTSAATPIVSGVAALLRQANSDLTWRDLKLILAASARKNDAANSGWVEGARKYGAGSATDRYHFNHEYGFGMVDAKAAVDIARGWTNVPPLESVSAASEAEVAIPPPSGSIPQTVTTTLTLNTRIRFTEFVEVNTDFEHTSFRDMDIELVSPSGAVSKLTVPFNTRHYTATYRRPDGSTFDGPFFVRLDGEFRFGSARHLGEDPNGQWTLRLTDHFQELGGTLRSWSIKVYGHVSRSGAPTITTPVTAGADSLTVAWSAPVDDGGPAITAYDLRYIQTSADETVDANWTLVEDVWMGSGPLNYIITGLTRGTQYDVQVRAVSADGDGPWSATATGTTGESDQEALVALYNATEGSNWANNTNWLSDKPLGEWHGVTTDANGRVTHLDLSQNGLTGEIPSGLGSLTNLDRLYLHRNQLTREIPPELGSLTNLTVLDLDDNDLTGTIPTQLGDLINLEELHLTQNQLAGEIPTELARLTSLKILAVGGNQLTGEIPPELGNLVKLEQLYLWGNELTGEVPSWLGVLSNLEVLSLSDNQLAGEIPPELGNLVKLEQLYLWGNELTGEVPSWLGVLSNLEVLSLSDNQLAGEIPPELGSLTNLTVLDLDDNDLTGTIPTQLGDLINLEELHLTQNQLAGEIPTELARLTSLKILAVGGNQLTGEIPPELGNLVKLEQLYLWGNELTGEVPSWLGVLSNLEVLSLSDNQLAGEIPPELSSLTNLTVLDLNDNDLTGTAPTQLGDLINLEELHLTQNQLAGEIPPEFARLTSLKILAVGGNQLTGEIPPELGNLVKLEQLHLWGNELTGEVPSWLGVLSNLEVLSLSDNQLAGEIPPELGNLANLERLYLWDNELSGEIPSELSSLTGLSVLDLSGNELTGEIPSELRSLANLEILSLSRNRLTGDIPAELGGLTNLENLWLNDNQLTGEIPPELGNLVKLEHLYLWGNELTGMLPDSLTRMTALTRFFFYNNPGLCAPVGDAFQEWLESIADGIGSSCAPGDSPEDRAVLVKLHGATGGAGWGNSATWLSDRPLREWYGVVNDARGRVSGLFLHRNQLTGTIPPELGTLSSLEWVSLYQNQLTGEIPAELGNLTNLAHLRLDGNRLTGTIPAELGRLTNLTVLYLSGNPLTGCVPASLRDVEDTDFAQLGLTFCTSRIDVGIVGTYDKDKDGVISITELFDAIDDYFAGGINISELFEVIDAYFG